MNDQQLDRIEKKLDALLNLLGIGSMRPASELRREALATVLRFQHRQDKKRGHERENKNRK